MNSHTTVDIYSLNEGHIIWSHQGKDSPVAWNRGGRAVKGSSLYIAGGQTNGQHNYAAAKYDVTQDQWTMLPDLTWPTSNGPVVFVHGDRLYSADGDTSPNTHVTHELDLSRPTDGWRVANTHLPHNVINPRSVVTVQGTVYVFGNFVTFTNKNLQSWNPSRDNSWKKLADANVIRLTVYPCVVSDGYNRIWVFGGCRNCWPDGFMERYDIQLNTWTKLSAVPNTSFEEKDRVSVQVCGYSGGYIYAVFASEYTSGLDKRFHVYNTMKDSWVVSNTMLRVEAYDTVSAVIHPS